MHISPAEVAPQHSPREKNHDPSPRSAFDGLIAGTVPPINVLIVEDNIINQKLLEAFMKRLNVRWKCVVDGEEAARRLEWLNGIGVLPKTISGCSSVSNTNPYFLPEKEPKHGTS
ncbi:hypothetical protein N7448_009706 [Penicillium atrosanguineum]|uniref:Response regulatory domain-containing protein n=1 Tax=Penicillium atrosanguineum TaxID=1132637 RepID=A0A9W9PZR4_9EURO|nr:hypothetical protein N7448_009706 [Penicillium atrosanguineum]KAJ5320900.1 hypothetical protein N7476_003902 [Penicillium atrosanguineum]